MRTSLSLCLAASWMLVPALVAYAADTHEGTVVSVQEGTGGADGKLVMSDKDGKGEHAHMISSNAKIMRDSKTVKLGELKKGDSIKVTTASDGKVTDLAAMQRGTNSGVSSHGDIPDFLANLNLTADQKEKIKNLCQQCAGEREAAWKQFNERCREAVEIEASMLASIEEQLTDVQKKHIGHQRQRMMDRKHRHASQDSSRDSSDSNKKSTASADDSKSAKTSKGDSASTSKGEVAKGTGNDNDVVEEITVIGVNLSPEQETATEHVRGSYLGRLRRLSGEMQEIHGRLVAMETERLLKIEDILTKEQRQQLRKDHQKVAQSEQNSSALAGNAK